MYVKLLLIFISFFYNCNSFLFFIVSHEAKEEECLSCHVCVRTVDSFRFYEFCGDTADYTPRYVALSKTKSSARDFSSAIYGNRLLAIRGISKSESHCRY